MLAYLDCASGISGDKFVAALVDAGADPAELQRALDALGADIALRVERVSRRGVSALSVRMETAGPQPPRNWRDIRALIETADLAPQTAAAALRTFELIARAEAEVHGVPADEVHFHEVGAADSIGDIVAACQGVHALGITRLVCSPLALGSGTVEAQHGTLPVPAPATALLVRGLPVISGSSAEDGELTTPTGAALAASLASEFGPLPAMTLRAVGHGAGTRETAAPNVARLFLGDESASVSPQADPADPSAMQREPVVLLATNIDHLSPEHAAFAAEQVLAAGALDVWLTPIVMKKGRPGLLFEALTAPESASALAERIAEETGSLGVRIQPLDRLAAPREIVEVATALGVVRVKVAHLPNGPRVRAEYEDCARLARESSVGIAEIARLAEEAARAAIG